MDVFASKVRFEAKLDYCLSAGFFLFQVMAEIPEFSIKPAKTTLKENTAVNLSCSANVGRPGGMVAIWKQSISSDVQFQLGN